MIPADARDKAVALKVIEEAKAWAEADLERAQPKYGEYGDGLLNAQALVRAILSRAEVEE